MLNQQNKTEDIFSEVEVEAKTSVTQIEGQSIQTRKQEPKFKKRFDFRVIIKILVIFIVLVLLVLGTWFFFFKKSGMTRETEIETLIEEQGAFVTTTPAVTEISKEDIDTDNDGLTDSEEQELGTDQEDFDTDDDGLSDKEEVRIYLTDPWDQDSDGDGIKDGEEVRQNKNPNNSDPEAKLFDLQKEIEKLE
ncbi:MAG: hypothetical protein PHG59_02000 [Patescibacteria group bacterium]|jgi:cytoskeletal protein RodZ|nr:hypothetical protein [Patescibacteria group bacterium]